MKFGLWRILLLATLCSLPALGQEFTGHVTDSTGAAVPKVSVTAHNVLTNVDTLTTTTGTGDYTVPYLIPGSYQITATATGFAKAVRSGLTLQAGQTATVNLVLKVGATTETVTVTGDSFVNFGKGDLGEVIENARVTELPLNGRDPGMLSELSAGAVWNGNLQWTRPFDDTQSNIAVNGGGNGGVSLMLDGVNNTNASIDQKGTSRIGYVPLVDSVQEFKMITSPYDAQYGLMSGGVEDVVLKSGTNKFHGDVYEYARRTWLDANTWANDYHNSFPGNTKQPTPNHKQDQYGAELDGPVFIPKVYNGRDKTFFTLQYERWNELTPSSTTTSVPDPAWLKPNALGNYDFSNLKYWNQSKGQYDPIILFDPKNISQDPVSKNWTRVPFPGNIIPGSRANATALKVLSYYPAPNTATAPGSNPFANNYTYSNPTTNEYRNVLAKVDENLGANDRLSIHYAYWQRFEVRNGNGFSGPAAAGLLPHTERSHGITVDETHTFTPNLLFDFRSNVTVRLDDVHNGPSFSPTGLGMDAQQVAQFGAAGMNEFPWFNISEFTGPGATGSGGGVGHQLSIVPSITWIKGRHTFHGGLDSRFMQQISTHINGGPEFDVDRQWTQMNCGSCGSWDPASGNSIASLMLGNATGGKNDINAKYFWSNHYWAPFVQDDWKATSKLTLNLGVRWDFIPSMTERNNATEYHFNTTMVNPINSKVSVPGYSQLLGGVTYAGVNGNPRSLFPMTWTNIQPRVGFAYAVDSKLVVRGGFGESFQTPSYNTPNDGFSAQTPYQAADPNFPGSTHPNDATTIDHPFPFIIQPVKAAKGALDQLGGGPWTLNPHYKAPAFWNYSLGVERQFFQHDLVNVSYVGSRLYGGNSDNNLNLQSISARAKCNPQTGGLPGTCDNNNVPNPFLGHVEFQGQGYYDRTTINALELTRPFPEFQDVQEWGENNYHTWYNSLQVTGMHRWSNSLTMHGTWTWSKLMNSGSWADKTNQMLSRHLDGNDNPHVVTLSGVYILPVGRGRSFLPNANRIVDGAIGGWELSGLYIYRTGSPWGGPGNQLRNAYVKPHVLANGNIQLVSPCVEQYDQSKGYALTPVATSYSATGCAQGADFRLVPSYGVQQNIVYSGIRTPANVQFDMSMAKNFQLYESSKLQIRMDGFNILNHPVWNKGPEGNANSSDFGTIVKGNGTTNYSRKVQLSAKVIW